MRASIIGFVLHVFSFSLIRNAKKLDKFFFRNDLILKNPYRSKSAPFSESFQPTSLSFSSPNIEKPHPKLDCYGHRLNGNSTENCFNQYWKYLQKIFQTCKKIEKNLTSRHLNPSITLSFISPLGSGVSGTIRFLCSEIQFWYSKIRQMISNFITNWKF